MENYFERSILDPLGQAAGAENVATLAEVRHLGARISLNASSFIGATGKARLVPKRIPKDYVLYVLYLMYVLSMYVNVQIFSCIFILIHFLRSSTRVCPVSSVRH